MSFGYKEFCRNTSLNLFIAFQIAIVFIIVNLVVGFYNNITMLYNPYKDILTTPGFYLRFNDDEIYLDESVKSPTSMAEETTNKYLNNMRGNKKIIKEFSFKTDDGLTIKVLDDKVFSKLILPLSSGKIDRDKAVVSYNSNYKPKDNLLYRNQKIPVSGVLTQVSYIPELNTFYYKQTDKDFYENYNAGINDEEYAIMCKSTALKYVNEENLQPDPFLFVIFDNISDTDYQYNISIIKNNFTYIPTERINANSIKVIDSRYKKYIPLIAIVAGCVIIGITSYSIVSVLKSKNSNEIYYTCGASTWDCFLIVFAKGMIIFISALIISMFSFVLMIDIGVFQSLGIKILLNNIYYSALVILSLLFIYTFVSLLIFLKLRRKVK